MKKILLQQSPIGLISERNTSGRHATPAELIPPSTID